MSQEFEGALAFPKNPPGETVLELHRVILEANLKQGDPVSFFLAPDKRLMFVADEASDLRIEKIGAGYITFNKPILEKGV